MTIRLAILAAACVFVVADAAAQNPPQQRARTPADTPAATAPAAARATPPNRATEGLPPLPADSTTNQTLTLPDRTLNFTATAGTIRLYDPESGAPRSDIAYIAYRKTDADPTTRPVAFVFNGGPGSASGWLHLGGLGPWRLPMTGDADRPSAPPVLVDNGETWLDFTDLVFIDPPGTGYSRILGGDEVRKTLWSVNGDVAAVATMIRRWSEANDRSLSPKYIVGESYGGIRAPKVASQLQTSQGVGIAGLVLVSPALDMSELRSPMSVTGLVGVLPSMVAAKREKEGALSRDVMRDVEDYATSDFLADLLKGPNDKAAVSRLVDRVASLTGLEKSLVARMAGRVPMNVFRRAAGQNSGTIGSAYDANAPGLDSDPYGSRGNAPDQLAAGLNAPIIEAMVNLYRQRLKWVVENGRYVFANEQAPRQWDYGRGPAESIGDLRKAMALDPGMRVLVAQGFTDTVVPYFMTKLLLDQIPLVGPPGRLRFQVYPGGHMMYIRDASRAALRADARALFQQEK